MSVHSKFPIMGVATQGPVSRYRLERMRSRTETALAQLAAIAETPEVDLVRSELEGLAHDLREVLGVEAAA